MDFNSFLENDAHVRNSAVYTRDELHEAFNRSSLTLPRGNWVDFVERFNRDGFLLKQGGGWKVASATGSMHGSSSARR